MKRIGIVIVLGILLSTISCTTAHQQYALNGANLTVDVASFKSFYSLVEDLVRKKQTAQAVFTEAEWVQFEELDSLIDSLVMRFENVVKLDVANIQMYDVEFIWELASESYKKCRLLVESRIDKFSDTEKVQLKVIDKQVVNIDKEVKNLFKDPTSVNITKTLVLITNVLSITIKVMGLLAI